MMSCVSSCRFRMYSIVRNDIINTTAQRLVYARMLWTKRAAVRTPAPRGIEVARMQAWLRFLLRGASRVSTVGASG